MKMPEWITAICTAMQVFVLGSLTYVLAWRTETKELDALAGETAASNVAEDYRTAAYRIAEHGAKGIDRLVSLTNRECLDWGKEVFLYELIRQYSLTEEQRTAALRGMWSAWKCNPQDLGKDVYLYEVLKQNAKDACAVVQSSPPSELSALTMAALIEAVDSNCPKQQPDILQKFRDEIEACTGGTQPQKVAPGELIASGCTQSYYFDPWPKYHADWHPTGLQDESWRYMVFHVFDILGGSNDNGYIREALQTEPLWSKILFARFMVEEEKEYPAEARKRDRLLLDGWIRLAMSSADSDAKSVALRAIHRLQLHKYKQDAKKLAQTDADPEVRYLANEAVDIL